MKGSDGQGRGMKRRKKKGKRKLKEDDLDGRHWNGVYDLVSM